VKEAGCMDCLATGSLYAGARQNVGGIGWQGTGY